MEPRNRLSARQLARVRAVVGCVGWLVAALPAGCGNSEIPAAGPLSQPTVISLYPVDSTPQNPARLYVLIQAVGQQSVRLPLAFDTGSSGITINALSFFPVSVVTPSGFVFPQGSSTMSYQGITVTNQQGTRSYGGITGRTELGNIGYATVTFGDQHGILTTNVMPVFLYYAVTENATGAPASPQQQQGWFGVNSRPDLVTIKGSQRPATGYPACQMDTSGSCFVDSVLEHLPYSNGIDAGFALAPAALTSCDITVANSCMAAPMLTVGLTSTLEEGFNETGLTCPPPAYTGPSLIGEYAACQPGISNSTISSGQQSLSGLSLLFDSGTPDIVINVPMGKTFQQPQAGASVGFTTPSGFVYSMTAGSGVDLVQVNLGTTAQSVVGLPFFTTNGFFIDFSDNTEGWK